MRCLFAVRFLTIVALGALALETPIPAQEGVSRDQVIRLIDRRVAHKAGERNLSLNDACTDAEFIRRVHLDLTGVVPRPTRVQQFLGDDSPEKRRQLIDELLDSPSYATHMANNW